MQGSYRHEPFNTTFMGEFTLMRSNRGKKDKKETFAVQKQTQAKLNFDEEGTEFHVEIQGGLATDTDDTIML